MMPSVTLKVAAAAVIALAVATPRSLAADGPQPGLWKVTIKTQSAGPIPIPGAPDSTHTSCITPEMAKNPEKGFTRGEMTPQNNCRQTHTSSGSTLSWKMEFSGQNAMTGTGSITFDTPQHYNGTFKMAVAAGPRPMEIVTTMEGQRVGECQK